MKNVKNNFLLKRSILKSNSGDTIIEVILSTVVLSIVLATAYGLSNRATQISQSAFERTEVASLMREQVEILREVRNLNQDSWAAIKAKTNSGSPNYDDCDASGADPFFVNLSANIESAALITSYSGGQTDSRPDDIYRIWLEAYSDNPAAPEYIDIHVRACWEGIGAEDEQRSGFVVRLNNEK